MFERHEVREMPGRTHARGESGRNPAVPPRSLTDGRVQGHSTGAEADEVLALPATASDTTDAGVAPPNVWHQRRA